MATRQNIDSFLAQQHIAVAGYSRNPKKFGTILYDTLKEKGYQVYAVNPAGGTTPGGQPVFPDMSALPAQVKALVVVTKPEASVAVVDQALEKGIDNIWVQQMSDNQQVKDRLAGAQVNHVTGRCILMHASPTGIHKFHRWIAGVFGRLPK